MDTLRQPPHRSHPVRMEEDAGALRRAVGALAAGLPGMKPGVAELVATELATNILRHTRAGGYVLFRRAADAIEFLAVDHGPGEPVAGFPRWAMPASPGGTEPPPFQSGGLGVGLAGVQRLSSAFDCHSSPAGTVILARLGPPVPTGAGHWRWGGVNVPLGGTGDSGDAWAVAPRKTPAAVVVDGLGHGPDAAVAAHAAITTFEQGPTTDLGGFVRRAHEAMRGTRGGVIGVCAVTPRDELSFVGVGNIAGRVLLGGKSQSLPSRHGTLGTELRPPQTKPATGHWGPGATLVLASDGIRSGWDLSSQPALLHRDPAIIAAVVHRDHDRGIDDATVLVVRDMRGHDVPGGYPAGGGR